MPAMPGARRSSIGCTRTLKAYVLLSYGRGPMFVRYPQGAIIE